MQLWCWRFVTLWLQQRCWRLHLSTGCHRTELWYVSVSLSEHRVDPIGQSCHVIRGSDKSLNLPLNICSLSYCLSKLVWGGTWSEWPSASGLRPYFYMQYIVNFNCNSLYNDWYLGAQQVSHRVTCSKVMYVLICPVIRWSFHTS